MPDVDGYGLIAAVRSKYGHRDGAGLRAVALTAYKSIEVIARARAAGFDAHATKPIDPDLLIDLIAELAPRLGPDQGKSSERLL